MWTPDLRDRLPNPVQLPNLVVPKHKVRPKTGVTTYTL